MILAVALSVAVTFCYIDHVVPMHKAMAHAHDMSSGCVPDLCVTVISKDPSVLGKTAGFFLLLSALLFSGPSPSLADLDLHQSALTLNSDHPPRASNKLYRLHSVYLL